VKKLFLAISIITFMLTGFIAGAQASNPGLALGTTKPTLDGVVVASEYGVAITETNKPTIWLSKTTDTLYVAVSADTTGWVAVGFGSLKMDGALMLIGFVGSDGKAQLKLQKGAGHSHGDVESDALLQFAMKEQGGKTVLEAALKVSSIIGKDAKTLPMIWAIGGGDNFTSFMRARGSLTVDLK
jgi:hypothetical protein